MIRALGLKRSLQSFLHHQTPPLSSSSTTENPLLDPLYSLTRPFTSSSSPPPPPLSATPATSSEFRKYLGYSALLLGCAVATYYSFPFPENAKHKKAQLFRYAPLPEDLHTVSNWSGTHDVQTRVFLQPETLQELEKIVKDANEKKQKIRPVGSGLSPNGIGLAREEWMLKVAAEAEAEAEIESGSGGSVARGGGRRRSRVAEWRSKVEAEIESGRGGKVARGSGRRRRSQRKIIL